MKRTIVADAIKTSSIGRHVRLQGWIRTRRDSKGGFSFLELNDGSCLSNMQIVCEASISNYESEIKRLSPGCSVSIEGVVGESIGKGQATELHAHAVAVVGWSEQESYPLQKKRHSFEKLREWAHLRPRTNSFGAVARVRNCICRSIHDFFQENGFLYIHTPIITASDCEGAGELFRVTTLNPGDMKTARDPAGVTQDFFDRPTYLTVSGQLNAEIFACSLGNVYTFGPTFRAEKSNTSRHLAEFWMVEPEMAFCDLDENMDLSESLLKRICHDALVKNAEDMEFFNSRIDDSVLSTLQHVIDNDFVRLPYSEAVKIIKNSGEDFRFPLNWGHDLQSEHERFLTERQFQSVVILYDYPQAIKPFYMRINDDELTVRAMDILVPKVGEIIGGSQREERLDVLTERMLEQQLDVERYWWYLDLRKYGTVPHSGFGMGLERVVQFVTGMANIRDVIPFPRTPGSADF